MSQGFRALWALRTGHRYPVRNHCDINTGAPISLVDPSTLGAARSPIPWRHHIEQALMLVITAASIWLISQSDPTQRLAGFVLGAAIQPMWIYTSVRAGLWGYTGLAVWYLGVFVQGIANHL